MPKNIAIVGAGSTGIQAARQAALTGMEVILYDINGTVLRRALERLKSEIKDSAQAGSPASPDAPLAFSRIHPRTRLADIQGCEIVIECVIEDLKVKKDLFRHFEVNTKSSTLLATTTSSLSVTAIASAITRQERVVGLHFPAPPLQLAVVEVVRGDATSSASIERAVAFVNSLGKTPIVCRDLPGFVLHRLLRVFHGEAWKLLGENVATAEQIDAIVRAAGIASGPCESLDQLGIDTDLELAKVLYERSAYRARYKPHPLQLKMVESGYVGKKSGQGFYRYDKGAR